MTEISKAGTDGTLGPGRRGAAGGRIAVALCTGRTADAVRPALESLAGQRAGLSRILVVTSGLADDRVGAHARQARALGVELVSERLPGLSRARNRAVSTLGDETVVAFLDDDAIAAPEWAARLAARWQDADDDVACIGGAVIACWQRRPPRWATGSVLAAFSLLDLGPGVIEMAPPERELYGANISFAVEALRDAGGFDLARGAWADVPLMGEESLAQRQLVERGWRVLYAGDVRVEHVIAADRLTLPGLLRRRFYYGASGDATLGGPIRGAARSAKAAAGAAVALAARDVPLAGERTARAAVNAGVVLGPLVRRRLRRRGWP
jgi:glycosyltransferase involved in cell wall biosynthesis